LITLNYSNKRENELFICYPENCTIGVSKIVSTRSLSLMKAVGNLPKQRTVSRCLGAEMVGFIAYQLLADQEEVE
jgi:hypothetical protein